ncbi:MAG TPA: hypothetical protein VNN08_20995 [Thermoanaerobaculia bacterium]|nr:hypothetical protein [Thermoanaerobaculia bacterium]
MSLSADGNTAILGRQADSFDVGAAWVWTRSAGVWTQQGGKLIGSGALGHASGVANAGQGASVSLSADGNTAIVGGPLDHIYAGAAWVWIRRDGVWTQQAKLIGSSSVMSRYGQQGVSVSLSGDGNTAIVGGVDHSGAAAVWIWTRRGEVWTQQGTPLSGSGAVGNALQGGSVSLSGDGSTALVGGPVDNGQAGAVWVFAAVPPRRRAIRP